MTVHVGIYPGGGELSYYDDVAKCTVYSNIENLITPNGIEKVSLMFEEIKSKIRGKQLGFACICLNKEYGNEIRKKFIEEGIKCGFKNVEIINWQTTLYLEAMSQIKYKPLNGNIIWLEYGRFFLRSFHIWQINDQKAEFIDERLGEISKEAVSKTNEKPDVVFSSDEKTKEFILKISPDCQFFVYYSREYYSSRGSLLKARITAGDPELVHLNIRNFLIKEIALKLGSKEIISFKTGHELPIFYSQQLIKKVGEDVLEIVS
uniref:Uncharacterized protein n=1 Tax=Panagrolaimus davidi TaxID=227884 RepID=A0A914PVV8_9BILA